MKKTKDVRKIERFRKETQDTVAIVVILGKIASTFCSKSALSPSFSNVFIFLLFRYGYEKKN